MKQGRRTIFDKSLTQREILKRYRQKKKMMGTSHVNFG